jgi:hypothetical protein
MTNIIISIYQYRDTPGSRLDAAIAAGKLHIGSDGLPRHRDGTRAAWFGPRVGWGTDWADVDVEQSGCMGVGE